MSRTDAMHADEIITIGFPWGSYEEQRFMTLRATNGDTVVFDKLTGQCDPPLTADFIQRMKRWSPKKAT